MAAIELPHTPSTNSWAKEHAAQLAHGDIVVTPCQTAGRGQRGNTWEAAPGKNLTFSILLRPERISPSAQFLISEIVSLSVAGIVTEALASAGCPMPVKVKWPNDIYVGDRKIAGILIEHSICGQNIGHTIAGIGLNVNQTEFLSDAPNPVSMAQLANREFELNPLMNGIRDAVVGQLQNPSVEAIHSSYHRHLWRNDGNEHPFSTPDGERFKAAIDRVEETGLLSLRLTDGTLRQFAFKEVAFIL